MGHWKITLETKLGKTSGSSRLVIYVSIDGPWRRRWIGASWSSKSIPWFVPHEVYTFKDKILVTR